MTLAGNNSGVSSYGNRGRADGLGTAASFSSPRGVAVDAAGTFAIVVREEGGAVPLRQSQAAAGATTLS